FTSFTLFQSMRGKQLPDARQVLGLAHDGAEVELQGCVVAKLGVLAYWALVACTAGIVYVLSAWFPAVYAWMALRPAALDCASYVRVLQAGRQQALEPVAVSAICKSFEAGFGAPKEHTDGATATVDLRTFSFKHSRFVFCPSKSRFIPVSQWKDPKWHRSVVTGPAGLCCATVDTRARLFGKSVIDIQEKSYLQLLWEEALNPLYIFQVASIAIWCGEEYYYYAATIFVISAVSIASTLVSTKQTARKLRAMSVYVCPTCVLRDGSWVDVDSSELVPGDIVDLSKHSFDRVPCELVLVEGSCIVDESMLTGESIPENKVAIEAGDAALEAIDMAAHTFQPTISRHILFAGTQIIRVRTTSSTYSSGGQDIRATAMVLRTGFCTTKGTLVRSILFPHPTHFRFYRDALRFVWVMAAMAAIGFVVNTINLHRLGVSASEIAKKALDIITVIVPPALPASMSIGMVFAARRLRKEGIFCISPSRINVASMVSVVVCDKTGTLTEEGLDLLGVHPTSHHDWSFLDMCKSAGALEAVTTASSAKSTARLAAIDALATCHSLNLVDGVMVGDPLEIKMVEFVGWRIVEGSAGSAHPYGVSVTAWPPQPSNLNAIDVIRRFEFAPELCRASVIASRHDAQQLAAYVKGAPEVIRELCLPESIPVDFGQVCDGYTQNGYRVLALAGKLLDMPLDVARSLKRAEAECELAFMGFLVFENRLKPATAQVLQELCDAKVRAIMCTGDNPLTAVSVARECSLIAPEMAVFVPRMCPSERQPLSPESTNANGGYNNLFAPLAKLVWTESSESGICLDPVSLAPMPVDPCDLDAAERAQNMLQTGLYHLAITGSVFEYLERYHSQTAATWIHILKRAVVYARMSPEQKALLIEHLQRLGCIVGFCGDGANDCAALKTADIGLSLSEAEASVAAPFTSRIADISSVIRLLKEGRCSIATSFACFKYMALYSMIQFTTCCILYGYDVNLTNGQYLFIDLFTILSVAVCIDRFKPFERLVPKRPPDSLVSKEVLTSLLGHIVLVSSFQVAVFLITTAQPWYQPPRPAVANDPDSTPKEGDLNTSMYLFSAFQYLFMGVVFGIGPPYRQPMHRNYLFLLVVSVLLAFDLGVLLAPVPGLRSMLGLVDIP
ncbi:hypothetical protein IWW55_003482, partial [Coemansia sp. RSA 2706]